MTCLPVIDDSACLAHGDCEELAPDVFRIQDTATVIATASVERLIPIAEACPASAISLIDQDTGERIYP